MTKEKFVQRLIDRYSNSNEQKIEDIENWIERENLNDHNFETLDLLLQTQYSKVSFPLVKDINDIYNNGYSSFQKKSDDIYYPEIFVKYVIHQKKHTIVDIIKKYQIFEKKQIAGKYMHCYERYFLFIFSDVVNNYRARLKNDLINSYDNEEKTKEELQLLIEGQTLEQEKEIKKVKKIHNLDLDIFVEITGLKI